MASLVELPSIERYEGEVLTEEQARKLLEAARGSRLDTVLLVALTTGIRRGELVSLQWGDIDFETGVLHVRRNVARMDGVGYIEKEPKSKAGRRKIALPNIVFRVVERASGKTATGAGESR